MPLQPIYQNHTDALSPTALAILQLNLRDAYTKLVVTDDGNAETKAALTPLRPEQMISGPVVSRDDARAMMAGLWLWHDWLDLSHEISQQLHFSTGSFWHAIMHRREGDFSNSKYWYARCENHPILPAISQQAGSILNPQPASKALLRLNVSGWNPNVFVDLVQKVHTDPTDPLHEVAISLQQLEWRLLFDHCARAAAGK